MALRLQLSETLHGIAQHVYFQPPTNAKMQYPCVVYELAGEDPQFADNRRYAHKFRYTVTVIDRDPDSPLREAMLELPLCSFDRRFMTDGLNHDVFTLYF